MNELDHELQLTSGEISSLWIAYQYETLSKCGLQFFLQHVNDKQTKGLLEEALALSNKRIKKIGDIFSNINYPIPQGFTDGDVNLKAKRLFSDVLYLEYILQTLKMETINYATALMCAVEHHIVHFFKNVMDESTALQIKAKKISKQKGLYITSPTIAKPKQVQFVKKDSFLAGWFGNKRPLIGSEISSLILHTKRNALGQAVITAFSQVAQSKEVRNFFQRGRDIAGKHLEIFATVLHDDFLPSAARLLTSEVTDSVEAPFSDKLMMFFITELIGTSIGSYGHSMAMSPRRDLGLMYTRLMAEIAQYADDGAEILIKNGWMEQPPMAADRRKLAK